MRRGESERGRRRRGGGAKAECADEDDIVSWKVDREVPCTSRRERRSGEEHSCAAPPAREVVDRPARRCEDGLPARRSQARHDVGAVDARARARAAALRRRLPHDVERELRAESELGQSDGAGPTHGPSRARPRPPLLPLAFLPAAQAPSRPPTRRTRRAQPQPQPHPCRRRRRRRAGGTPSPPPGTQTRCRSSRARARARPRRTARARTRPRSWCRSSRRAQESGAARGGTPRGACARRRALRRAVARAASRSRRSAARGCGGREGRARPRERSVRRGGALGGRRAARDARARGVRARAR